MLDLIFKPLDFIKLKSGITVQLSSIKDSVFIAVSGDIFTYDDIYLGELEFLRKRLDILSIMRNYCKNSFMDFFIWPEIYFNWKNTKEGESYWENIFVFHRIPDNKILTIF